MTQIDTGDFGVSVFAAIFASTAKEHADKIVLELAKTGRVDVLEAVLEHGMIPRDVGKSQPELAFAILPILSSVAPQDEHRARRLVDAWLSRHEIDTIAQMKALLTYDTDAELLQQVIARGGRALDADDSVSYFVERLLRERSNPARSSSSQLSTALRASAWIGNYEPIARAVDHVAWTDGSRFESSVAETLREINPPPAALAHIRNEVTNTLVSRSDDLANLANSGAQARAFLTWSTLLHLVQPTAAQWQKLLTKWADCPAFPAALAGDVSQARASAELITTMANAGVIVDDVLVRLPGKNEPTPLLHRAVLADNVEVVGALLAAGADPNFEIAYKGEVINATSLAPIGSATRNLVNAWAARSAMIAPRQTRTLVPA